MCVCMFVSMAHCSNAILVVFHFIGSSSTSIHTYIHMHRCQLKVSALFSGHVKACVKQRLCFAVVVVILAHHALCYLRQGLRPRLFNQTSFANTHKHKNTRPNIYIHTYVFISIESTRTWNPFKCFCRLCSFCLMYVYIYVCNYIHLCTYKYIYVHILPKQTAWQLAKQSCQIK